MDYNEPITEYAKEQIRDSVLLDLPYVHRKTEVELNFKMIDESEFESDDLKNLRYMFNAIPADYVVETDTMIVFVKRSSNPLFYGGLLSDKFYDNSLDDIPSIHDFADLELHHKIRLLSEYINSMVDYTLGVYIPDQIGFLNLVDNIIKRKYNCDNDVHHYVFIITKNTLWWTDN